MTKTTLPHELNVTYCFCAAVAFQSRDSRRARSKRTWRGREARTGESLSAFGALDFISKDVMADAPRNRAPSSRRGDQAKPVKNRPTRWTLSKPVHLRG